MACQLWRLVRRKIGPVALWKGKVRGKLYRYMDLLAWAKHVHQVSNVTPTQIETYSISRKSSRFRVTRRSYLIAYIFYDQVVEIPKRFK
ncbi:hypothetical protein BOTCAL_0076g00300 [Botryotinia calthae]|uniref:Uncharacterized protein n=1 Tax=Botryotinia calthae TaxID=38488 RepID=A0A4Y8DAT2_9HELO|nr:hypothetical protein BOTCAL_0076g00300 [Botryotinia calthae]